MDTFVNEFLIINPTYTMRAVLLLMSFFLAGTFLMSFTSPVPGNTSEYMRPAYLLLKKSGGGYVVVKLLRSKPSKVPTGQLAVPATVTRTSQGVKIKLNTSQRLGRISMNISSARSSLANGLRSAAGLKNTEALRPGKIDFRNGIGTVPLQPDGWIRDSMFLKRRGR